MDPVTKAIFFLLTIVICGLPATLMALRNKGDPVIATVIGLLVASSMVSYISKL